MGNLTVFLMGIAVPLVKRVLVALGVGIITYTGYTGVLSVIEEKFNLYMGQVSQNLFDLVSLLGFQQSVGIILGAFGARAALTIASRLGVL